MFWRLSNTRLASITWGRRRIAAEMTPWLLQQQTHAGGSAGFSRRPGESS